MIEDNLLTLLILLILAGIAQYAFVRKHVTSIADPLFIFVITSSFSLALGCIVVDAPWLLARILLYFVCFYVGFSLASGKSLQVDQSMQMHRGILNFRIIVIVCCLLYLGLNMFMWIKSGLILFSDDPSLQKSEAYAGGFGFIRRFNWSVGVFVLISSIYWWIWERSIVSVLTVMIVVLTALTGGGKGALLSAVFAVGLFIANPFATRSGRNDVARIRRAIPVVLGFAFIPVIIVLVQEHGTATNAFNALIIRFFYYGDVLLYWGQQSVRSEFASLGPLDYLCDTFGSILGGLRLTDYSVPIGNQFVRSTLPVGTDFSENLGPNLTFYVRGELYLGPIFALLHALIIGFIFGRIRKIFLTYRSSSLLIYSLLSFAVVTSMTLPTEEGLAVGTIFDFILFFLPIYLTTSLLIVSCRTHNELGEHPVLRYHQPTRVSIREY